MTSRNNIKIFYFNGVNVAKHWHVAGEVFAISDCVVCSCVEYNGDVLVHLDLHVHILVDRGARLPTRNTMMYLFALSHLPLTIL